MAYVEELASELPVLQHANHLDGSWYLLKFLMIVSFDCHQAPFAATILFQRYPNILTLVDLLGNFTEDLLEASK